tara:strand:+ start:166 stop:399 length:234 start_codon:yes stop_codon:yes gene_type:complete
MNKKQLKRTLVKILMEMNGAPPMNEEMLREYLADALTDAQLDPNDYTDLYNTVQALSYEQLGNALAQAVMDISTFQE